LATEAGFMNGHEVVKVTYDKNEVRAKELASYASTASCAQIEEDNSYRSSEKDLAYQLQHSDYKYLPLTPYQRTKINSALGAGKAAEDYLSPQQKKWLADVKSGKLAKQMRFKEDFKLAWQKLKSVS